MNRFLRVGCPSGFHFWNVALWLHSIYAVTHECQAKCQSKVRKHVNEQVAELVAWSLGHAACGIAPSSGFYGERFDPTSYRAKMAGQPLAGSYKFLANIVHTHVFLLGACLQNRLSTVHLLRLSYLAFKADLKARKEAHYFDKNYSRRECCERCKACQLKSNAIHMYSFKNMSPSAPYAQEFVTHESYLATTPNISPWAKVAGFQIENCSWDWMRVCFLGTAPGHIASCLKLLKHVGYSYSPDESDAVFLRRFTIEMRAVCKKHGHIGRSLS